PLDDEVLPPGPDGTGCDVDEEAGIQRRLDVLDGEPAVQVDRTRPKIRTLVDPERQVLADGLAPGVRVGPATLDDLALLDRQPSLGVGLGREGVRCRA